jgi:hypothetical protein
VVNAAEPIAGSGRDLADIEMPVVRLEIKEGL